MCYDLEEPSPGGCEASAATTSPPHINAHHTTTHHNINSILFPPFHNAPQMPPHCTISIKETYLRTFSSLLCWISISFSRSMSNTWFVSKEYCVVSLSLSLSFYQGCIVFRAKNIGCLAAWHPGSGRYNPTPSQ